MALIAAKCTQCGSNIQVDDTKEAGTCKHCGTAFITEKVIKNFNTYNNVTNIYNVQNMNMQSKSDSISNAVVFENDCYYPPKIEKNSFERMAFIALATNIETPCDILKSNFSETKNFVKEYWIVTQDVKADWSASVGYDRNETYTEYVQKTEQRNGRYRTRSVPETRTRTFTDWKPASGKLSCSVRFFVNMSGPNANEVSELNNLAKSNEKALQFGINSLQGFKAEPKRQPNNNELEIFKAKANEELLRQWKSSAQGDRQRDFSATFKASNTKIRRCFILLYALNYSYKGVPYSITANAVNNELQQTFPKKNNIESEIKVKAKAKVRKWIIPITVFMALALLCVIGILIIGNMGYDATFLLIPIIAFLTMEGLLVLLYYHKYEKVKKEIFKELQDKKLADLNSFLSFRGYAAFKSEETVKKNIGG